MQAYCSQHWLTCSCQTFTLIVWFVPWVAADDNVIRENRAYCVRRSARHYCQIGAHGRDPALSEVKDVVKFS
jgi:hypothetical protein